MCCSDLPDGLLLDHLSFCWTFYLDSWESLRRSKSLLLRSSWEGRVMTYPGEVYEMVLWW